MNTPLAKHEKEGIIYFTIPAFENTGLVLHAFSGRKGGTSTGPYDSLNLSILTDDSLDNVIENRRRLLRLMGISPNSLVGAHQVHRDNIYRVKREDKGAGAVNPKTVIPATDALMTNERGLALTAFFADCVPVFYLDPVNKAVALAHAGWKGTVAGIAAKTVAAMQAEFGTDPDDLLAAIGPSIGPCHYQVDTPVIESFKEAFPRDWDALITGLTGDGHGQLNLWEANARQLRAAGVRSGNITTAGLCTYCRQDIFFSHRGGAAGRQAALIMLK